MILPDCYGLDGLPQIWFVELPLQSRKLLKCLSDDGALPRSTAASAAKMALVEAQEAKEKALQDNLTAQEHWWSQISVVVDIGWWVAWS